MTPESLRQVRQLVDSALDRPAADRHRFLIDACGDDEQLLRSVHDMIELDDEADSFMELSDNPNIDCLLLDISAGEPIGMRIGRYRIMQVLASGGMGTVYLAVRDDEEFEKQVAIKLINRGMNTRHLKERFHRERRLLAKLEHPNIASLLDGGTTFDDRPYMVMEYVEGVPIDMYCDERACSLEARLELFLAVCDAVHSAHQNLIIHRDLKPSNILVTDEGLPKLVDFGISRMLDEDGSQNDLDLTQTGQRAMTPQYASPEQVRGDRITTASDLYSLGVVLYELLSGHRPYQLHTLPRYEKEQIICEIEPVRLSQMALRPRMVFDEGVERIWKTPGEVARDRGVRSDQLKRQLHGDLDNIVLKTMSKRPERRYPTVQDLAADIRRHLEGKPVMARASTFSYRASKFIRRNKTIVAAAFLVGLTMIVGTAASLRGFNEARLERNVAMAARRDADDVNRFLQQTLVEASPYHSGHEFTIEKLLEDASTRLDTEMADRPRVQAGVNYAIAETYASLWDWPKAADHARTALELYDYQHGRPDQSVADCLVLYGHALVFQRRSGSVEILQEAMDIRSQLYDELDVRLAECKGYLGFALWYVSDPPNYDEAERLYLEALRFFRAKNESPTELQARITFGYAAMLRQQQRFPKSDRMYREAIKAFRAQGDGTGRYMIECLRSYAYSLRERQHFAAARDQYREVIELMPRKIADPALADACWQLGLVELAVDRREEAERLIQRAIRIEVELTEDAQGQLFEFDQSVALFMIGESTHVYDDVFRALMKQRPHDHDLALHFAWLGEFLRLEGRIDEAEALYLACYEAMAGIHGEESFWTADILVHWAQCVVDQAEYERAEAMLREGYRILIQNVGQGDPRTRNAKQSLITLYERWQKPDKLRTLLQGYVSE
ncbi:MAG: serine/threonine-protein kinase [Planctomycetota bacterium]|nr:serine/threonine-protein kinase [Planctomycetota bacterium]